MCEYCKNFSMEWKDIIPGDVIILETAKAAVAKEYGNVGVLCEDDLLSIPMRYCPNCGDKLDGCMW